MADTQLAASWPGATAASGKLRPQPPQAPKVRPSMIDLEVPWLELPTALGKGSPVSSSTFYDEAASCSNDGSPLEDALDEDEVCVFPMGGAFLSDDAEAEEDPPGEQVRWSFEYRMLGLDHPEAGDPQSSNATNEPSGSPRTAEALAFGTSPLLLSVLERVLAESQQPQRMLI